MPIERARVEIEGTEPLLWHHFGPDAISLEAKPRSGKAGNDPEEWRKTVLHTAKGQLYLLPTYVFGCLRAGAKYTPRRRGTLQPYIAATLKVLDKEILIDRWMPKEPIVGAEKELVYLDSRSVINPGTGKRNIRYRVAVSPPWRTSFNLLWENTVVSVREMEAVVRDAGTLVGLGSGRDIGFGRFKLIAFEVRDDAKKPTTGRNLGKNSKKSVVAGR